MKAPSLLLPGVCAHCHRPLADADAAFCPEHWPRLGAETRRAIVGARDAARKSGGPTKALLHAVRRGQRELAVAESLAAHLAGDEGGSCQV
jgi:hypothetical protein